MLQRDITDNTLFYGDNLSILNDLMTLAPTFCWASFMRPVYLLGNFG